jgi:uncharacterized protein YraI
LTLRRFPMWFTLVLFFTIPALVLAQVDSCSAIIRAAIESAQLECAAVVPGEVCYGSAPVEIDPPNDDFSRPGRIENMNALTSLQTGQLDEEQGEWGVAVAHIQLQVNPPAQAITIVAFGDSALKNLSESHEPVLTVDVRVTFAAGANVRAQPAEDSELVAQVTAGQIISATGLSADNAWIRLFLPDGDSGWVSAELVAALGDLDTLPVGTSPDTVPESMDGPWQLFNLKSGANETLCDYAPESGVVIQAADDAGEITLVVNDTRIIFAGTVYLQAKPEMGITALEGNVRIESGGETTIVIPGTRVRVRYDAQQGILTTARQPEYYEYIRIRALPLALLPRPIDDHLTFNLLGVVTPVAPAPLDGVNAESPCTVAAFNDEGRLRTGPGREYPIVGGLLNGESANPDARATALDGTVWWRLREGMWARVDVVYAAGQCSLLPMLAELPPVPVQSE